jgi:hypothetical protein
MAEGSIQWEPGDETSFEGIPVKVVDILRSAATGTDRALVRVIGLREVPAFMVEASRLSRGCRVERARVWHEVLDVLGDESPAPEIRYALAVEGARLLDEGDDTLLAVTFPFSVSEQLGEVVRTVQRGKEE